MTASDTVRTVDGPGHALRIEADFAAADPDAVFDALVDPATLGRWWPQEATTDPRPGGAYHLSWPAMEVDLRGEYTVVERPGRLAFTWRWDHQPELPDRTVDVTISPAAGGSTLALTQSGYRTGEAGDRAADVEADAEDRRSHIDGWVHFLGRLQSVLADTAPAGG